MKTISEAKAEFNNLASSSQPVLISKNSKIVSVLLPYELYCKMYAAYQQDLDQSVLKEAKAFLEGKEIGMSDKEMKNALEAHEKNKNR